jgi:hypothetical protein
MTEQTPAITDAEAQDRIRNMFVAIDEVFQLHGINQEEEPWTCIECSSCDGNIEYPCQTVQIILKSLGLPMPDLKEETPTE